MPLPLKTIYLSGTEMYLDQVCVLGKLIGIHRGTQTHAHVKEESERGVCVRVCVCVCVCVGVCVCTERAGCVIIPTSYSLTYLLSQPFLVSSLSFSLSLSSTITQTLLPLPSMLTHARVLIQREGVMGLGVHVGY